VIVRSMRLAISLRFLVGVARDPSTAMNCMDSICETVNSILWVTRLQARRRNPQIRGNTRKAPCRSRLKICCEQFSSNHRLRYSAAKLIVTFSDGITELFGVIASIALDPNGRDRIADLTKIRMLRTLPMFSCVNAGPATDAVRLAASLFSPGQSSFPTSPAGQMGSLTQFARSSPFETSARFNHRCSPDSSLTQASGQALPACQPRLAFGRKPKTLRSF
jgi:hypothetical protein